MSFPRTMFERAALRRASLAATLLGVAVLALAGPQRASAQDCSWVQRSPDLSPAPRRGLTLAYDSNRGVTVLFGGSLGENVTFGDTWEWDGERETWTRRCEDENCGPGARYHHAMAYDSNRGVTVLFGGTQGQAFVRDTWEWDGRVWEQKCQGCPPPPRAGHAMAYDSDRGVTVLFGGVTIVNGRELLYNDTWEWDGDVWIERPVRGPSPRGGHTMAYDSDRGVTVLFGGINVNEQPQRKGDTWEWNGQSWTERPVEGPSPRHYHDMVYDSDSDRPVTVLFGGADDNGRNGETWEWNGEVWTLASTDGPLPRYDYGLAYDSDRRVSVLFGGTQDGRQWFDDTWEYFPDCNCNGVRDSEDVQNGNSEDRNGNWIPDECEPCEFIDGFKVHTKDNRGRCKIRASAITTLPEGTELHICFEGDDDCGCKTVVINDRGRGKAMCVTPIEGDHRVCIQECPDICREKPCHPTP